MQVEAPFCVLFVLTAVTVIELYSQAISSWLYLRLVTTHHQRTRLQQLQAQIRECSSKVQDETPDNFVQVSKARRKIVALNKEKDRLGAAPDKFDPKYMAFPYIFKAGLYAMLYIYFSTTVLFVTPPDFVPWPLSMVPPFSHLQGTAGVFSWLVLCNRVVVTLRRTAT